MRKRRVERLPLRKTRLPRKETQLTVVVTPLTVRMGVNQAGAMVASSLLTQRGQNQSRRGPRRIKTETKKRRQLLPERQRRYVQLSK